MDLEQKLEIIQIARVACGTLAIVFLLLTIFLFWRFHIISTFMEYTGLAKRKAISSQKEINANSGRMKKSSAERIAAQEFTGALSGERKRRGKSAELQAGKSGGGSTPAGKEQQGTEGTTLLRKDAVEEGTMRLDQNSVDEGTKLLNQNMVEEGTMLLRQDQPRASTGRVEPQNPPGFFRVVEDIQVVHSEERI